MFKFIACNIVLLSCFSMTSNLKAESEKCFDNNFNVTTHCYSQNEEDVVFSYKNIFETYYNKVRNTKKIKDDNIDFETFVDFYYMSNKTIQDYTNDYFGTSSQQSSRSSLAYYALGTTDYSTFPAGCFSSVTPYYDSGNLEYYNLLNEGDIIYETSGSSSGVLVGHTSMIYDLSRSSYYGNIIISIDALNGNTTDEKRVQFCFLDDNRMVDFGVVILRPVGTSSTAIINAKYFTYAQLAKPYSFTLNRANTSINSTEWYCSELVWAAYLYTGINICASADGNTMYYVGCILPSNIALSVNTYRVLLYQNNIQIKSYISNGYAFYNARNFNVTAQYNSKLCFESDAANWTSLYDLVSININSYSEVLAIIQNNWFANTAVIGYMDSYIDPNTNQTHYFRYITYLVNYSSVYNAKYVVQSWTE